MPKTVEIFWNMIKNRRWIKRDLPMQDFMLVALSFGVIAYIYSEEQDVRHANKLK
jgi:hypothetical protein